MQNQAKILFCLIIVLLSGETAYSQQNHSDKEQLSFEYHYFRVERATLLNSVNLISRSGAYVEFQDIDSLGVYWDWYYHLAVGFSQFEASESNTLETPYHIPYQVGLGTYYRFGRMRSVFLIFGIEGASELYANALSPTSYELKSTYSGRVKLGLGLYLMSLTAANAEVQVSITQPITAIEFEGDEVKYNLIGEGLMKLKFHHASGWGLIGKARFEDYENVTSQRTYFNARLMAGFFFEW